MALILMEGFDHMTAAQLTLKNWSQNPTSMQTGRFAGQAARLAAGTMAKTLPSTYTELFLGFAWDPTGTLAAGDLCVLTTAGAVNAFRIRLTASGPNFVLSILNSGGTVIASGTTPIVAGTWYYIEARCLINGASGSCTLKINGATEIAATTGNFGSTAVTSIGFTGVASSNVDDVYVLDTTGAAPRNTFLGDVRIATIMPSADGASSQWTPSSGTNHFDRVNQTTPDDDTTYISDSTVGHIDEFVADDVDSGATVFGVQTNLYARKDDANVRQIAPVIRQAGVDNVGNTVTLGSTYAFFSQLYNQDPSAADWTAANVNADQYGVKTIS